ncbi:MAG: ABC transporter permease [Bacillota bacterium]
MQTDNSFISRLKNHNEFYLLIVVILVALFMGIFNPDFLSLANLLDILVSYSFMGILAAGLLLVLISGGIDISFTATVTVAQYIMATVIIEQGGNLFIALIISCLVGIGLGLINALLISRFKVPAIIITVATLNAFHGLLIFITGGKWIYNFPLWFGKIKIFEFSIGQDNYALTNPMLALILVIFLTWFILNKTTIGRKIYAMGGNQEAARRAGFNLFKLHLFVYGYMGFVAGIAAVIQGQLMQTIAPNSIVGRELEVLAAVVLGGASLFGGRGSVLGTVLGVTLMAIVQNGLIMLGVPSYWHDVFIGLIIIISVSITAYQRKLRQANEKRSAGI